MILVVHPGSRIRILTFYPSRIPDPGVKKAPDPGSGTLILGLSGYLDGDRRGGPLVDGLESILHLK